MLEQVEWGEFKLWDLFEIQSSKAIFHANNIETIFDSQVEWSLPYVVRTTQNNWVRWYIIKDENFANDWNTLSFAQDTFSVFYQRQKYFTWNKVKVLKPKFSNVNENIYQFICACFQKSLETFTRWTGSTVGTIAETKIQLPTKNWWIHFEFINKFIAELEAESQAELEAYLETTWLKNYELTSDELKVLKEFEEQKIEWKIFNLEDLFWKSTRWKRLKSDDRIPWNLPFVTAWEADEWISAFIWNDVTIFSKNTTTIDMFGSAKYRNYEYWWDDHVAIVHTELLPKYASIFITTAIHKSSHNWQFDYWKNFYAKDADELNIKLPIKDWKPDYEFMETFISAIHKLVIKDVVIHNQERIKATKEVINK